MAQVLDADPPESPHCGRWIYFTDWADFLAAAPDQAVLPDVQPDDLAQIQYTSGTTGFPKGAELHHRGLTNNARFYAERIGLRPARLREPVAAVPHGRLRHGGAGRRRQRLAVHVPVLAFDPALMLELLETERAAMLASCADHDDRPARGIPT